MRWLKLQFTSIAIAITASIIASLMANIDSSPIFVMGKYISYFAFWQEDQFAEAGFSLGIKQCGTPFLDSNSANAWARA